MRLEHFDCVNTPWRSTDTLPPTGMPVVALVNSLTRICAVVAVYSELGDQWIWDGMQPQDCVVCWIPGPRQHLLCAHREEVNSGHALTCGQCGVVLEDFGL